MSSAAIDVLRVAQAKDQRKEILDFPQNRS